MARTIRIVIFAALSAGVILFIFGNSVPSIPESRETSLSVAALLRPFLDPNYRIPDDVFHNLIRKLAHFVEFGVLGLCLTGLSAQFYWKNRLKFGVPVAGAAMVALLDEGLQYFTGRGNSIRDVGIDCAGALCGVIFVAGLLRLLRRRR